MYRLDRAAVSRQHRQDSAQRCVMVLDAHFEEVTVLGIHHLRFAGTQAEEAGVEELGVGDARPPRDVERRGEVVVGFACRDELLAVLRELGARPEVIPLGPAPVLPLGPPAEALDLLRFRMVVGPGTEGDARLQRAMERLTELKTIVIDLRS